MKDKRKGLNFSNEEIIKKLIDPIKKLNGIDIRFKSCDDEIININGKDEISFISLDGEEENFFISFYSAQISIFFLDEEIMIIDDEVKKNYTTSDTMYNIVYEGKYIHNKILEIVCEMIKLLNGAKEVSIKLIPTKIKDRNYETYIYELDIKSNNATKERYEFDNIIFNIK